MMRLVKFTIKNTLICFLVSIVFVGCISTAKISDFSQTSDSVDFERYYNEFSPTKPALWTAKTNDEYYFEGPLIEEEKLISIIKGALVENNYELKVVNANGKCVIGKRGMKANEWASVTAVYYKWNTEMQKIQVLVSARITQDVTGGWGEKRAMKVGRLIQEGMDKEL